ncbi:MAG: MmcQ/YjbR family DNA-binding protein [Clostridia bacterium]|nr:MmcQ/YjbR family DNA-binding protein [Clostridia bacterium]
MDIEGDVFRRKRFETDKLLRFGFTKTAGGYRCERIFMGGDFSAALFVSDAGEITGTVTDEMNKEEYRQLRMENLQGPYVSTVRARYTELLEQIAKECCIDVQFSSDQANRIAKRIRERCGVEPDYPWAQSGDDTGGVFRHTDNAKWFALIMNVRRRVLTRDGDERSADVMNLKAPPEKIESLTARPGVYSAYHMNRKHWISVILDDTNTDESVMELVEESYRLTGKKGG